MAKITPALPNGPTVASVFGEDWIQNDLANLTVDYKASLAENVRLGSCVYFNSLNKKWSILNGMNPPKNAMLGIVIHVDSEGKGQVKIHGIFESPLLEENKLYYVDSIGNLTITVTQVPFGQTTGRGILILKINGGDPSGGGSGGGESQTIENLEDYSPISTVYPYQAIIRGKPSSTSMNPMVVRFFAMVLDSSINATVTNINMNFDEACPFAIGEVIQIDYEKLRIVNISGNVVVVERGVEGTLSAIHTAKSNTSPVLAFGKELEENPSSPVAGQYQVTNGALQFSILDKRKLVFAKYDSVGRNFYKGSDSLRNYVQRPTQPVIAIQSGTVSLVTYQEAQFIYVRKGAQILSSAAPGFLLKASNGIVISGVVNSSDRGAYTRYLELGAFGTFPFHEPSNGGGGGSLGIAFDDNVVYGGSATLPEDQRLMYAQKNIVCYGGSANENRAGGGTTVISPFVSLAKTAVFYNHSGNGGGGCAIFSGEKITDEGATFNVNGVGNGWVLKNEYGGMS